ncbi:hypothetical protein ACG9Y7_02655 [Acinetobacter gerneri]|uniref:hypothetical protein n=1 Tax=Acinetobacter gerneri TaxID=202952 RepID=UPI003AF9C676
MDEATIKSMAAELAKGLKTPEDLNQMTAVFKKFDRDGAGGSFNSTDILTLKNVDTTVDELIKNHQLLY